MLFAALKLIAETIHELGILFFSKGLEEKTVAQAPGGYVIRSSYFSDRLSIDPIIASLPFL